MEFTGLLIPYRVNRPLTAAEKADRLSLNKPSPSLPDAHNSVIELNSIYVEVVDKFFATRGASATFALILLSIPVGFFIWISKIATDKWSTFQEYDKTSTAGLFVLMFLLFVPLMVMLLRWLFKEIFCYTHYPIRFNRKLRKVYVFRRDGTVMEDSWDKLLFTLAECNDGVWDIRGYRLADDGETVLEAFSLPFFYPRDEYSAHPVLWSQWEFIRRYMENGEEDVKNFVHRRRNIAIRKESFFAGLTSISTFDFSIHPIGAIIFFPLNSVFALGRWLAMRTCRVPKWPQHVEDECKAG